MKEWIVYYEILKNEYNKNLPSFSNKHFFNSIFKTNGIFCDKSPSNFQVKGKNYSNRSINRKLDFCGSDSHLGKVQYRILNPHQISKSKKKKLFKSVEKQRNWTFVVLTVIWGKYYIGF